MTEDHKITIRVSEDEYRLWESAAKAERMPISAYIRETMKSANMNDQTTGKYISGKYPDMNDEIACQQDAERRLLIRLQSLTEQISGNNRIKDMLEEEIDKAWQSLS